MVTVTSGRDFGDSVEIVAGLKGNERIVLNPPDSLTDGQTVRVAQAPSRGSEQR
jgi:multidrug efflux pump subunit AcrA (membrane-fusion protein)